MVGAAQMMTPLVNCVATCSMTISGMSVPSPAGRSTRNWPLRGVTWKGAPSGTFADALPIGTASGLHVDAAPSQVAALRTPPETGGSRRSHVCAQSQSARIVH